MNAEDYVLLQDSLRRGSPHYIDWDDRRVVDHGYPQEDRVPQINLELFLGRNAAFWPPDQNSGEAGMGWGWCRSLAWARAKEIQTNDFSLWIALFSSFRIELPFTYPLIIRTTVKPPPQVSYLIGQVSGFHTKFEPFYTRRLGTGSSISYDINTA